MLIDFSAYNLRASQVMLVVKNPHLPMQEA